MNVRRVEKALKFELRRFEMEASDKITKDLEDVIRRHNSKTLHRQFEQFKRKCQSGLVPLKKMNIVKSMKRKVLKRDGQNFLRMY